MEILVLSDRDVETLLSPAECMAVMEDALAAAARGEVCQPLRSVVAPGGVGGLLGLMPGYLGGESPAFGIKVITVFPGNRELGIDSHQGAVLLLDPQTGKALAVLEASALTGIRTAAVSAVATRLLAREDAGDLALIGAGVQAAYHLEALAAVRDLRRVRVVTRSPETTRAFIEHQHPLTGLPLEAAATVEEAVRGADLVLVATTATSPVLSGRWLSPGAHVVVIGGPGADEVDGEALRRSALFVDDRVAVENESREYVQAVEAGIITPEHVRATLGEVLAGLRPGRSTAEEVTLFKSMGLAIEDLAAAAFVYSRACDEEVGTWVTR